MKISVAPGEALIDEPLSICVEGAGAQETVHIAALLVDDRGRPWIGHGVYTADANGTVDVERDASVGGSYTGRHPDGLFWSASPFADTDLYLRALQIEPGLPRLPELDTAQGWRYRLTAWTEHATAKAQLLLRHRGDGVSQEMLRHGRLRGQLFLPDGPGPFPGLVLVGGSDGGLFTQRAELLASHGIAALALAYFNHADLPEAAIELPIEYFREAVEWMKTRLGHEQVGFLGVSRGGELALILGSTYPDLAKALVAWVPSHIVNSGEDPVNTSDEAITRSMWSLGGAPLPFAPFPAEAHHRQLGPCPAKAAPPGYRLADDYQDLWNRPETQAASIEVERIIAPLMLVGGRDDGLWPSGSSVEHVARRIEASGSRAEVLKLNYDAGHSIFLPRYSRALTHVDYWGGSYFGRMNGYFQVGGTPESNARAAADSWRQLILFLNRNLAVR